ncbi:MAG: protein-tyrosine phosphatase [Roseivirga sp.]|jgi:protein-tyrosine phosphatase
MSKVKVLFVCLGNICRSPLAEGIFMQKLRLKGLDDRFEVDSCGTSNYHIGESPDSRTIVNAVKNGIDLDHKGKPFKSEYFFYYDYMLPMDQSNLRDLEKFRPDNPKAEVFVLRTFDLLNKGADVPDPYYAGEHGFQEVFDIIDRSCEQLLVHLIEKHHIELNKPF